MKIVILLDKEDIKCQFVGTHISIDTGSVQINLTPDAYIELLSDLKYMIENKPVS